MSWYLKHIPTYVHCEGFSRPPDPMVWPKTSSYNYFMIHMYFRVTHFLFFKIYFYFILAIIILIYLFSKINFDISSRVNLIRTICLGCFWHQTQLLEIRYNNKFSIISWKYLVQVKGIYLQKLFLMEINEC